MRNSETHFEQVPIEIVESIIQRDTALDTKPEKSRVLVSAPEQQTLKKFPDPLKKIPSKGQR
jgi:hypothetical protein